MSKLKKFVIFLLIMVLVIPAAFAGVIYSKLKTMQANGDFSILNNNKYQNDSDIINVLLIGSDARPGDTSSRSDSMMILTVDNKHKSLKLTSLGRDTYVSIPGHGFQKLTHAYAFGKEKLLIETIEDNFQIDIHNYAKVDFYSFIDIVDSLGGITLNVEDSEVNELNKYIPECYNWDKNKNKAPIKYIENSGKQELVGYQALSYVRIRKNDGTMQRDNRQRLLIEAILEKISKMSVITYPKVLNAALPYIETNMNPTDILFLAKDVLSFDNIKFTTMQFPLHPENEIRLPAGGYVIPFEQYELKFLHNFIFSNKIATEEEIKAADDEWNNSSTPSQYANISEYSAYLPSNKR